MKTIGWWVVIGMFLATAPLAPAVAEAKELSGTGTVRAVGTGSIGVRGKGVVTYTLDGKGRLVVAHPHANTITAHGEGTRHVRGAAMIFTGYKGTVMIRGPKVGSHFAAGVVKFFGKGRGRVVLRGSGKVWVNGHGPRAYDGILRVPMAENVSTDDAAALETDTDDATDPEDVNPFDEDTEQEDETDDTDDTVVIEDDTETTLIVETYKKHPRFVAWAKAHPAAYKAFLKKGVPYRVWAKHHPAAARALHEQRQFIKNKLDKNDDGKVDKKEWRLGRKDWLDKNDDGKVDKKELKLGVHRHRVWKRRADKNKDHKVDRKERAIDALKRKHRRIRRRNNN
ncbi:MAG: hypothetical protein ACOC8E_03210 [Planctomycetota bacterium]